MTSQVVERYENIIKPGKNCIGTFDVQETGLLIDACDYYRAFYHAALQARHYLLMAGWQFDTEVRLLRGSEAEKAGGEVRFLPFLESLCERNPNLEIYILAWDFSMWFMMEREWFQDFIINWSGNGRIRFRFDGKHSLGATHHQKFIVIDGTIAFLGGLDICSDRWDDRRHLYENPERKNVDGNSYGAYHDIQSYHTGPLVKELVELFKQRWLDSGAGMLRLSPSRGSITPAKAGSLPLDSRRVALSRTQIKDSRSPADSIREIRRLFVDAIIAADELIYLENQYFSSQALYLALINRMMETSRSRLQVIMILPDRLPATEEMFIGVQQVKMLRSLLAVAAKTGHFLGVYSTECTEYGKRKTTFIHSKLLLVDDRFLTVGSANTTNRSLGLDTELNASWEATPSEKEGLIESIRRVRISLLAEHVGFADGEDLGMLKNVDGLVGRLNVLAADAETRLCRRWPELTIEDSNWMNALAPISHVVDPDKPVVEELIYEYFSGYETSLFARGILLLSQWLSGIL